METGMYIDGQWKDSESGRRIPVINPATEETISTIPYGGGPEVLRAIEAAHKSYPEWSSKTPYQRAEFLVAIAQAIREKESDLSRLLTMEVGKPLRESRGEVLAAADQFEWYSEEVKRLGGDVIPPKAPNKRFFTLRHPVGVVAAISPWNFPLLLLSRKLAPALAAGCTVVARPSTRAPLSVNRLFALIDEVNLPSGAANLVFGDPEEQVDVIMRSDHVRKVSFTGSLEVGKTIMAKASGSLKKVSLELGGHAPFIIFADVDPAEAASKATYSKFRNMGQVCISPSRFLVHRSVVEEFTDLAVREVKNFRLGNGLEEGVTHGPLQSADQVRRAEELVADIEEKGGRILAGGRRPENLEKGFFFEPTIATDISPDMRLMKEEPFSPILPIIPFDTEEEAIRMANDTPYGLAAYVLTHDLRTAVVACESLEAGIIALNDTSPATSCCPFGGMKQSGIGREGWHEGLEAYYETKYVSLLLD